MKRNDYIPQSLSLVPDTIPKPAIPLPIRTGGTNLCYNDETGTDVRQWLTSWERGFIAGLGPQERGQSATVRFAMREAERKMVEAQTHRQARRRCDEPLTGDLDAIDRWALSLSTTSSGSGSSTPSAAWSSTGSECGSLASEGDRLWADMAGRLKEEYTATKMFDDYIDAEAWEGA